MPTLQLILIRKFLIIRRLRGVNIGTFQQFYDICDQRYSMRWSRLRGRWNFLIGSCIQVTFGIQLPTTSDWKESIVG